MNAGLKHGSVELKITDSYYNMREMVEPYPHIIELAKQAMEACDVEPLIKPIRGGTDGARLSFMGLPCLTSSPVVSTFMVSMNLSL